MKLKSIVSAVAAAAALTASAQALAVDPALIAARQKFFGADNVDASTGAVKKDKVILSWITNASYAASIEGRVLLLDTWVTRAETTPGRTPFVVQDLVDLHPEAILLGHGHGDHADNAAYIAHSLSIPIYATPETCDAMQADAVKYFGANASVLCNALTSRLSIPGAEIVRISQLEPLACIVAFKHIHSNLVPYDPTYAKVPIQNIADQREPQLYPAGTALSYPTTGSGGPGGPMAMFYQFVLRGGYNFALTWHNSTGPLKEGVGPDIPTLPAGSGNYGPAVGAHLFSIMDALPRTDVELGAIATLGYTTNGVRDAVMYNQHLRSKLYIPIHQDVVAVPSSSPEWRVGWLAQQDAMGVPASQRPITRWQTDPLDYTRPLVFTPGDPLWSDPTKASSVAQFCS